MIVNGGNKKMMFVRMVVVEEREEDVGKRIAKEETNAQEEHKEVYRSGARGVS